MSFTMDSNTLMAITCLAPALAAVGVFWAIAWANKNGKG